VAVYYGMFLPRRRSNKAREYLKFAATEASSGREATAGKNRELTQVNRFANPLVKNEAAVSPKETAAANNEMITAVTRYAARPPKPSPL